MTCRYDSREIIARIVDGSRISEFKPLYGSSIVTCWAELHGFKVGILSNNGPIFSDSANKATQFIEICDRRGIPLIFFHNVTGFMVGTKAEQEGIIKHGSKLINAVSNRTVPAVSVFIILSLLTHFSRKAENGAFNAAKQISVVIGASYGAGNYAMCGRAYDPRFLFAWPNAKVAVMGSEQLVGVLKMVQGKRSNITPEIAAQMTEQFKQKLDQGMNRKILPVVARWHCLKNLLIGRDFGLVLFESNDRRWYH